MKRIVQVINKGKRTRDRLGSRFEPNKTVELKVNSRQFLTLKAVKDLEVNIVNKDEQVAGSEDNTHG